MTVAVGVTTEGRPRSRAPDPTGPRIARARREANLTQAALAGQLGISLGALDRIERGEADPDSHVRQIAAATAKPENWFRSGDDELGRAGVDAEYGSPRSRIPAAVRVVTGDQTARNAVLASLVLLITIRFFTGVVHVLPHLFNFVDIPILIVLGLLAALHPSEHAATRASRSLGPRVTGPALGFLAVCILALLLNLHRVALGPASLFIYGLLAPLLVYVATRRLWPPGNAGIVSRLLIILMLVQFAAVVGELPRFHSHHNNPDLISGTFGENAYQLVFLLIVVSALLAGTFTFQRRRAISRFVPVLLLASFGVVFLAQYRGILVISAGAMLLVAGLLASARGHRGRGSVAAVSLIIAFAVTLAVVNDIFPALRFGPVLSTLGNSPSFYVQTRLQAIKRSIWPLFSDHPLYMLTGTGPGTYSSRAWYTFAYAKATSNSNVAGQYVLSLTGGKTYSTDVSNRYIRPLYQGAQLAGVVQSSASINYPDAEYTSVAAEVGVAGLLLIVWIYVAALACSIRGARLSIRWAKDDDPLPGLALAAMTAFVLSVPLAFLQNWLEVTRVTFICWILLAIVVRELEARSSASPTPGPTTVHPA
jgi:transcriptional regulator with XRE-family HTH domain